jgi:GNAT superfamily N-acetyltransferase
MQVARTDPRSREAAELLGELSAELSCRYEGADDGTFGFQPEDLLTSRSVFLIGRLDGRAIACGAFRPLGGGPRSEIAELKRMFVRPGYRGFGYSKRMLSELERMAGEYGYRAIRLETGDRQPEAIRLYESAGYRRIPCYGTANHSFEKTLQSFENPTARA